MEELKKKIEKLKKYGKKTISKTDLESVFATSSDEALFEIISILSEQQILAPIKNSKTNGNRLYPIYLKYKVAIPQETYETELKEINALHPLLQSNSYLQSKPEEYREYRVLIQKLDRYLFFRNGKKIAISRKERSFEIFDEEKALDDKTFCALLERIGITSNELAFYDTPEYCFNDYIPDRKAQMTLLICENKDIWFNIRRMMFENNVTNIFNTYIDGVVYGCGNKVSGMGALTTYTKFIGSEVNYLYWGDIDRAGLNIYSSAVRANPNIKIKILQLKDCRPYYIIFREYVFAHANNIFFFPIIFSLAEKYYAQLQDYAIPLLTNPDFIIFDLHRKVQENSFSGLNCIGLMHKNDNKLLKDFNNQEFRQRTLQDYAITLQFNFQYRGKVLEIIDKLYSDIGNEDAVALLNIQKMDLRKAVIYETDNPGEYIVEGKFEGKPKEIVEENAKVQEPIKKLIFEINSFIDDTTNCERADLNKLTAILDSIILYDITQISINGLNNHVKILILLALANQELDQEPRERYIRYMLGFLDGLIDMDQLAVPGMNDIFQKIKIFEKNEYIAIWKQLDFDISEELKEVIRYKIFQILLQGEKTDTLIGITRYYLSENSILEAELRKCLFLIAEDECDKRVAYYKKERIKKYQYDYFERFRTFYKGDAEVDECKIVSKEFVDDNLCYAISNYNLSVLNAKDYNILEKLYSGLKLHYEKHDHRDRINYYSSYNLHCCFFRNLIIDKQHADKVLDLLFKEPINISHDLVKFIQRIFEPLSVKFFDGYNNREIRNHIIYILGKLKKYLSTESLKKAFSNCALLTCSEYAGDWSLCKTNYLPSDKLFINKLLLEYGKYSPEQAIRNIYQLQPKELLPEVLIGLNSFVNHNTENMATTVLKSKQSLIEILSIALIEYKKELQNNKKYEEAFEGILSFLISLSIPEAAILLDDYRVY